MKKKLTLTLLLISFNSFALDLGNFIDSAKNIGEKAKVLMEKRTNERNEISNKKSDNTVSNFLMKDFINENVCSVILKNNGYFTTCYDYDEKGMLFGEYKLDGKLVNKGNIEKRPSFYTDLNIPKKFRSESKDYTHSGFDRSHAIANDASFDYELRSQKSTYTMSNILPHYPNTNRKSILAIEKYERLVASKLGSLNVFVVSEYSNSPKKIGRNKISVPIGIGKMYWNTEKNFKKCFYIKNDNKIYSLRETEVDCSVLLNKAKKMKNKK